MNKEDLDGILDKYNVQPVGDGYIDLIVTRENYRECIAEVLSSGFQITGISWWEWCSKDERPQFGTGGPKSQFYNGRFAELPKEFDEVSLEGDPSIQANQLFSFIESKTIEFPDEKVSFQSAQWLTPAIWLDVPDNWKNKTVPNET